MSIFYLMWEALLGRSVLELSMSILLVASREFELDSIFSSSSFFFASHDTFSFNQLAINFLPAFSAMTEPTANGTATGINEAEAKNLRKKPPAPSVLSRPKKIAIIVLVSAMTFIGPMGAGIYFPSLAPLAKDLHVSLSQISLTLTAYMVRFYNILHPSYRAPTGPSTKRADTHPAAVPGHISAIHSGHVR